MRPSAISCLVALLASPAFAEEAVPPDLSPSPVADSRRDEELWKRQNPDEFAKADANGDGRLDSGERTDFKALIDALKVHVPLPPALPLITPPGPKPLPQPVEPPIFAPLPPAPLVGGPQPPAPSLIGMPIPPPPTPYPEPPPPSQQLGTSTTVH